MVRKIYRAKNGMGETLGVILAKSEEQAHAFFLGRGTPAHELQTIDPADDSLGASGVVVLAVTHQVQDPRSGRSYLVVE